MNKPILKVFVGLIALSLAVCAAFFSIVGLSKLFAGAAVAIIVMASSLEASKLVVASFLYQNWKTVNKLLRVYLLIAVTVIAIITSIGIYGYLSGAYQTTKSKYDLNQTQTDSLLSKKSYYNTVIISYKSQLESKNAQLLNLTNIRNSQEQRATQLVTVNRSSRSADRSALQTDNSIKFLNKDIQLLNDNILAYSDTASKMQVSITQLGLKNELSSELGTLTYISKLINQPMDKIVNVLILLFIVVFDPLAICLVLAFNFLNINTIESNSTINKLPLDTSKYDSNDDILEFVATNHSMVDGQNIHLPPSETPQISPEIESLSTSTQRDNLLGTYNEYGIDFEQKKKKEKERKRQNSYSGATRS